MSRKTVLIILIVLGISTVIACTRLPTVKAVIWIEGHITSDTTWTPVDTYLVINDTYVDPGVTLTIEPGVQVHFADGFSLIVEGSLNASGTLPDPVVFTSSRVEGPDPDPYPGAWNTIKFKGNTNDQLLLNHVRIEYAVHGVTIESLGLVIVEKSEFMNCSQSGIHTMNESNIVVRENKMRANVRGFYAKGGPTISGIKILENDVQSNSGTGIYIDAYKEFDSCCLRNVTITGNIVAGNEGEGIHLRSEGHSSKDVHLYDVSISGNNVSFNKKTGIYLQSNAYGANTYMYNITISDNVVTGNGEDGATLYGRASGDWPTGGDSCIYDISIANNIISYNRQIGIYLCSFAGQGGQADLHDIFIFGNNLMSNQGTGMYLRSFSSYDGCYLSNVNVSDNVVMSNGENGIYLDASSYSSTSRFLHNVFVSNNTMSFNSQTGFLAGSHNIYDVVLFRNIVRLNGKSGISFGAYNLYNISIAENKVATNKEKGVYISSGNGREIMIVGNIITANRWGIFPSVVFWGSEIMTNVTQNDVSYNEYGILYQYSGAVGPYNNFANLNDIYANIYGMNVSEGQNVQAEYNYWGDPTGPYHPSLNREGQGNPVNGDGTDLDFIPFLPSPNGPINERPVAVFEVDKIKPNVNETVAFDATGSTDDGRIDYYYFDFGDGTSSSWTTLPVVTHKYAEEGEYNATLIIMDDFGVTSLDDSLVYVEITVVPEFPSFIILPLFMITTLLAVIVYRKKDRQIARA